MCKEGCSCVSCCHGMCNRLYPAPFLEELKGNLRLCWAMVIAQFCQSATWPTTLMFIGHLGTLELNAVALANMMINVFGASIALGLSSACDTLFSQTYGSSNKKYMGVLLQRGLVLNVLALMPCYALHLNMEGLLLVMGQQPEVARLVGNYLLLFTPGLWCLTIYTVLRKYLMSQSIVIPQVIIAVVGLAIHLLLQYIAVYVLDTGVYGSAIAQVLTYFCLVLITTSYIVCSGLYKETWTGLDWRWLLRWGEFMHLATFGVLMICIEWWTFEIFTLLAGLLGPKALAVQSILINLDGLFYSFPLSVMFSTTVRVGTFLGANKPTLAANAGRVGMIIVVAMAAVVIIMLVSLRKELPKLFTNDTEIIDLYISILPYQVFWIFFDYIGTVGRGIIQGSGRQVVGTVVVIITYYVFAMPIGISLAFATTMGVSGLWMGICVGLVISGVMFIGYPMFIMNWEKEASRAQIRVKGESPKTDQNSEETPLLQDTTGLHEEDKVTFSKSSDKSSSVGIVLKNKEQNARQDAL